MFRDEDEAEKSKQRGKELAAAALNGLKKAEKKEEKTEDAVKEEPVQSTRKRRQSSVDIQSVVASAIQATLDGFKETPSKVTKTDEAIQKFLVKQEEHNAQVVNALSSLAATAQMLANLQSKQ